MSLDSAAEAPGLAGAAETPAQSPMRPLRVALLGAPNSGKSTLFNGLTGGRAKTANYPGVTVERRSGAFHTPAGRSIELLDLPGVYGLSSRTIEERIALDAIRGAAGERAPDALIVLVDATDIRTHLHLVLQAKALGLPMIVGLNMIDLADRDGVKIDVKLLEDRLGAPVAPVKATRKAGRDALIARLDQMLATAGGGRDETPTPPLKDLQSEARAIAKTAILAEPALNRATRAVDAVLLNRVAGPIILAAILFLMFQAVFAWAEAPKSLIDAGFAALSRFVSSALPNTWFRHLLAEGVIAGVGATLVFLPQILILFTFILLLEASGYMARAAFLMDELMARVGLNGRAFIPLLSSFACAIPGMMAARTIDNERDRLTTIMIAPLMACSARLPVYTLIVAAFVPHRAIGPFGFQGVVMFGLYVAGIASAVVVALIAKRARIAGPQPLLLLELPTYKLPDAKDFLVNLWGRAGSFLRRAGRVILPVSIALWFLASYPNAEDIRKSYAGMIGGVLEPLLRPIGFNLEIAIALVPGLAAREVAVGALGAVYAIKTDAAATGLGAALQHAWSTPTALAFLAWYVYAPQCFASLVVARRETNSRKLTLIMIAYLFGLAYAAAGIVYWSARAAGL